MAIMFMNLFCSREPRKTLKRAFVRGFQAGIIAPALLVTHANARAFEHSNSSVERAWRSVGGYMWDAVRKERRRHGEP
jgi:hypothetical protein